MSELADAKNIEKKKKDPNRVLVTLCLPLAETHLPPSKNTRMVSAAVVGPILFVCKAIRHTMPCKQKMLGKEIADYVSGKKLIAYLEASEFHSDQGGTLFRSRRDCATFAAIMVKNQVLKRAVFNTKTIKKKTGKIKEKKIIQVEEDEPYVWVYNPVQTKTVMYGFMVLGAIVCCVALPFWPIWLRNGVAGFLMFVVLGRPLIQLFVYLVTFSRWHFMILPLLDEERPIPFSKRSVAKPRPSNLRSFYKKLILAAFALL
eukprot:gene5091-3168_t